jgi:hypothetical protein
MQSSLKYDFITKPSKVLINTILYVILGFGFAWMAKDILTPIILLGKGFDGRNDLNKLVLLICYTCYFTLLVWLFSRSENNLYTIAKKNRKLSNLIFGGLLVIAIVMILNHMTNNLSTNITYDETLYLTHMRLVMQGKIPYHDFYDWVPPVWLYVYAGVFKVFGENIITARALSIIFSLLTMVLATRLSWRLFGRWSGLITLGYLACVNPIAVELLRFYYTASGVFFLFLALTIEDVFPRSYWKVIFVDFFLLLTVGTVQAFGLILFLYPLYLFFIQKDKKSAYIAILCSFLGGVMLALPFLVTDYEATIWAMFSYNKEIMPIRRSFSINDFIVYMRDIIKNYYLIWMPILFYVFSKIIKFLAGNSGKSVDVQKYGIIYLSGLFFCGIAIPVLLFNPTLQLQQHIYYLVIGCIFVGPILVKMTEIFTSEWKTLSIFALIIIIGIQFTWVRANKSLYIFENSLLSEPDNLQKVVTVTKEYLKDKPDGKVFSFVPYFGLEAGGKIFPGTEYGITSFTLTWDEDKAKRYNFFTESQVKKWLQTRQPDLVILVDKSERTMYCCGPLGGLTYMKRFKADLGKNYYLDKKWFINQYWGNVEFYLPKE